ncbi:MAG: hypothetical protein LC620_02310 [Halobacteriales archaeon]|nr:hypothetical protein [Halobacteriales archaeon]
MAAIAVDPGDANHVLASGWGFWKSVDAGYTWVAATGPSALRYARTIVFSPSDPKVVYAFGQTDAGYGLYRSADGGETWVYVSPFGAYSLANKLVVHPKNANVLYGIDGYDFQLKMSGDGGKTWSFIAQWISDFALDEVEGALWIGSMAGIFATGSGNQGPGIYKGPTDGGSPDGRSWMRMQGLDVANARNPKMALAVAPAPNGASKIFACLLGGAGPNDRRFFVSKDSGKSWMQTATPAPDEPILVKLCFDPSDPGRVILVSRTRIVETTDDGATYQVLKPSLWDWVEENQDFHISADDPTLCFSVGKGGIQRSEQSGQANSWDWANKGIHAADVCALTLLGAPADLVAQTVPTGLHRWRSSRWSSVTDPPVTEKHRPRTSSFQAAGTSGKMEDYLLRGGGAPNEKLYQKRAAAAAQGWTDVTPSAVASNPGWTVLACPAPARGEEGRALAAFGQDVYLREKMASAWKKVLRLDYYLPADFRLMAWSPSDPRVCYIVHGGPSGKVWASNDGGATWAPRGAVDPVMADVQVSCIQVDPTKPNRLYIAFEVNVYKHKDPQAAQGQAVFPFYVSDDGGVSWRGGKSSLSTYNAMPRAIVVDDRKPTAIYVGIEVLGSQGPGVLESQDGGFTWNDFSADLPRFVAVTPGSSESENTHVMDLVLAKTAAGGRMLVAATCGRGIFSRALP